MLPEELKKLNNYKTITFVGCIFLLIAITAWLFNISSSIQDKFFKQIALAIFLIPLILVPIGFKMFFISKVGDVFIPYVLSQFKDWKLVFSRTETTRIDKTWPLEVLPPKDIATSLIFPIGFFSTPFLLDSFQSSDEKKAISLIKFNYSEKLFSFSNNRHNKNHTSYMTLITVKTFKNLHSTTTFKTYESDNFDQYLKSKLPEIDLPSADSADIEVTGNDINIAEKLATPELFSTLQTLKEEFDLHFAKAVFYDNLIIFALKHQEYTSFKYETFFIKLPIFKDIDFSLLKQAAVNFKVLTDLANNAQDFTKNTEDIVYMDKQ